MTTYTRHAITEALPGDEVYLAGDWVRLDRIMHRGNTVRLFYSGGGSQASPVSHFGSFAVRREVANPDQHAEAVDGHDDRYQLADVIVHAIAYPDRDFSDLLDEYDLPQLEDVATFEDLRMHVSTAAEALRFDPTGDAPGVAVTLADGRKLRIRFDWI